MCNDGYFDNSADEGCDPCDALCATCTGPLVSECLSCAADIFYLSSATTCYSDCPLEYFGNTANYLCEPCSQHCLTCTDGDHCTGCTTNYPLYQDICLEECPEFSTYENTGDNICVDCPEHCLTCSSSLVCLSCVEDYFLDELFPLCFPCHQYCKGCFGPASNQCLGCEYPLYLNNSQCYNISCPYGQYVDSLRGCVDCSATFPHSLTCNISLPLICKENYKLLGSACVECSSSPGYHMSDYGKCAEVCGDGRLFELQCDDGNNADGDGCSANCLLEEGWSCSLNSAGLSVCELTGEVKLSVTKYEKYGGQNKVKIHLSVSIPIAFSSSQFTLTMADTTKKIEWSFEQ